MTPVWTEYTTYYLLFWVFITSRSYLGHNNLNVEQRDFSS